MAWRTSLALNTDLHLGTPVVLVAEQLHDRTDLKSNVG